MNSKLFLGIKILLGSLGWPGTQYPSILASQILGLYACATTLGSILIEGRRERRLCFTVSYPGTVHKVTLSQSKIPLSWIFAGY
jgi:hypothetical protein